MNTADFKTLKNEQKTAKWLLANGISTAQFEKTDIWLLQAQKTAFYLIKHKTELLSAEQKHAKNHLKIGRNCAVSKLQCAYCID